MAQATDSALDHRSMALDAVRDPANVEPIAALIDLLWLMQRSRLLHAQGAPSNAVLVQLTKCGPCRGSDLARSMHLDLSTISRHLANLAEAGLVERSPDPADGRAHVMSVTPAGRDRAAAAITARVHDLESVIEEWPERDRRAFARLLARFSAAFESRLVEGARP